MERLINILFDIVFISVESFMFLVLLSSPYPSLLEGSMIGYALILGVFMYVLANIWNVLRDILDEMKKSRSISE